LFDIERGVFVYEQLFIKQPRRPIMGKRKKRLTMKKYAKKYAAIRATVVRLKSDTPAPYMAIIEPEVPAPSLIATAAPDALNEAPRAPLEVKKASFSEDPTATRANLRTPVEKTAVATPPAKDLTAKTTPAKDKQKPNVVPSSRKVTKRTTPTRLRAKAKAASRN
jgi:hypothetical protein